MTKIETGMRFNVPGIASPHNLNVDDLTLSIVRDDNGKPGTQILWSQNYIDNVPTGLGCIASFNVEGGLTLETGSKYWVVSRSTSVGTTPHTWYFANLPASEPYAVYYFRSNNSSIPTGEWLVNGAPGLPSRLIERTLTVTVIPEPAAAALMLAASAALIAVRRRTIL
ncbi:MAG: PEP-CTERM sorting domain-containing protein [Planctomycetaceae bacterium]|nr:PEP-CTERM sorting domain-containing protein [Planctomycetaceae bacterium]